MKLRLGVLAIIAIVIIIVVALIANRESRSEEPAVAGRAGALPINMIGERGLPGASKAGVLERGGVVMRGTVEDAAGGPIPGARIRFVDAETEVAVAAVVVDDSGHYSATLPAVELEAIAQADGYATAERRFDLRGRIAPPGDFELAIGGTIRGRVVGADGQPCREAKVFAEVGADYHRQRLDVAANAAGEFALEGLQAGDVSLHAAGPGCVTRDAKIVGLTVGSTLDGVTIAAVRGFTLTGLVIEKGTRKPIQNVAIQVDKEQMWTIRGGIVKTDAAGRYTVHGIEPGSYELDVTSEAHLVEMIQLVIAGDATRDIELTRGRTIRGRVEPPMVAKLALELTELGSDLSARRKQAIGTTSNADGTFVLEGVVDGSFVIGARSEDGTFFGKATIGDTTRELAISMAAFGDAVISGVVVEESGAPVAGLEIAALWPNDTFGERISRFSAADGSFRFERLPRREVVLVVERRLATNSDALVRTPGDHDRVRIVVKSEAAVIRGRVVDHDGKPAADVAITGMPRCDEDCSGTVQIPRAITDGDGAFTIPNLRDGSYALRASTPGGEGQALVTARTGETVTLTLERSARILLHVTHDGKPLESYRLGCRFDTPVPDMDMGRMSSFSTSTNGRRDGTYRSERSFPLGRAHCHVEAPEGGANVSVEIGRVAEVEIEPWAKVRATIVDGAGRRRTARAIYRHADVKPSPNADNDLAQGGYREYAEVGANGRLELDGVFAGAGWVAIYTEDYSKLLAARRIVPKLGELIDLGTITVD